MDFQDAFEHMLVFEGGLVDHPKDPGGITKYGISLRAYPDLGEEGIRNLTVDQAREIYLNDYWNAVRADDLPSGIDFMIFDCAVNQGPGFARRALQNASGALSDGIIGPKTLTLVNSEKPPRVLLKLSKYRMERYQNNKNWDEFGKGWTNRLFKAIIISSMEV